MKNKIIILICATMFWAGSLFVVPAKSSNRPFSNSTLQGSYIIAIDEGNSGYLPTLFTFDGNGSVWPSACPQSITSYNIDSTGNLTGTFMLGAYPPGSCVVSSSSIAGLVTHDGGAFFFNVLVPNNGYAGIGVSQ
jgi:hypothetical protein